MSKPSTQVDLRSSPVWEDLQEWIRGQVQGLVQQALEDEVTEALGRLKSQRSGEAGGPYRNGFGRPRRLTTTVGTVELERPRVRGMQERFESRVLPWFKRKLAVVDQMIPELYLHGLSEGDFDLALRGVLGEKAPLSPTSVARLKQRWQGEYEAWRKRPLDEVQVAYLWVDGVYVKAGLEKDKAAILVAVAALVDGRKVVLAVQPGQRESAGSWGDLLRDLKARGMTCPCLVVGDGHLGIWAAIREVYSPADEQRCWNHRIVNVLDKVPTKHQPAAKELLSQAMYAPSREDCEQAKARFRSWCQERALPAAADTLERDWERLVAYYRYPPEHWKHLRTTNPIESAFATLRLRTDAARRFKKVANATAAIWKLLLIAEKSFRHVDGKTKLIEVWTRHHQTLERAAA
jgi:transposase-like protein